MIYLFVSAVRAVPQQARHRFVVTLEDTKSNRTVDVDVSAAELLSYRQFQHAVLDRYGLMFRNGTLCEVLPDNFADEQWRAEIAGHVNVLPELQQQGMN